MYKNKMRILLFVVLSIGSALQAVTIKKISTARFLSEHPNVQRVQSSGKCAFKFKPFPLFQDLGGNLFVSEGYFLDSYILTIPQGEVCFDKDLYVFVQNCFIRETQLKDLEPFLGDTLEIESPRKTMTVHGRVAVISNLYPYCYFHWVLDVITKLAMLEMQGIEYDYVCIPYYTKFMQETLELWGIDRSKIIPAEPYLSLRADTIIMPTSVSAINVTTHTATYISDFILHYLRNKMLPATETISKDNFASKVFISRNDAFGKRVVPNEDEIFALFEQRGFKKYALRDMSVAQQIALFHNAKTIVSFHGAGLTNVLFCQAGTHIIEMFQKQIETSYWYFSQMLHLQYSYIDATKGEFRNEIWHPGDRIPLHLVEEFLRTHVNL